MGVFERMGRVISSNFNALLDSVEDPGKSVDLTLKEMGDQIRAARHEVVKSVAAEKQLRKKGEDLAAEIERWERRAELAIKHGDDDLAREALRHKRRLQGERERAERLRVEQRAVALELKSEIERMEAKLKELEARRGTLAVKARQAKAGGGVESLGAPGAGVGAFDEFRRMEAEIEGVEAAIEVQREVDEALGPARGPSGMTRDEVEAKFRALEHGGGETATRAEDVDDELAALKKRVRVEP
jgi:phage shock protein A